MSDDRRGPTPRHIAVRELTLAFGDFVLMRDLDFTVRRGAVFVIMGGSGSGKSTLLRHMIGLLEPAQGEVLYDGESFTRRRPERARTRCCGASASSTSATRCGAR